MCFDKNILLTTYLISFTLLTFFSTPAVSAESNDKPRRGTSNVLSMSAYKNVSKATEALQEENYDLALQTLTQLLNRGKRLTAYDQAKIYQLLMSVYIGKNDYRLSANAGEKSLIFDALIGDEKLFMHSRLFYVYLFIEDYEKAITHLDLWFSMDLSPDVNAFFSAAQLYASIDENSKALDYAQRGLAHARATTGIKIKENWYQLVISLNLRMERYDDASTLLKEAIAMWPHSVRYFLQLSAVYHELKNEKASFAVISIAYKNQLIEDAADLLRLTQYYRYHDYPSRGGDILLAAVKDKRIKGTEHNWQALSQAWMQAREWQQAEEALLNAAKLATTGENWMQLCQITFQGERWVESQRYCRKALSQGGIAKKEASTWYLLALAQYYDMKFPESRKSFEECAKWDDTKDNCMYWKNRLQQLVQMNSGNNS